MLESEFESEFESELEQDQELPDGQFITLTTGNERSAVHFIMKCDVDIPNTLRQTFYCVMTSR